MNRTVFPLAKQRIMGKRALFPQKSQKFLCLAYERERVAEARIRTKPTVFSLPL